MGLVEGIDAAVERERERLVGELRSALAEGPYNLGQVAALAGIGEATLRNILTGRAFPQFDTLAKVMFILGVRMDLSRGEGRPFVAVPANETGSHKQSVSSIGSRRSSSPSGTGRSAAKTNKPGTSAKDSKSTKWQVTHPADLHKRAA